MDSIFAKKDFLTFDIEKLRRRAAAEADEPNMMTSNVSFNLTKASTEFNVSETNCET